MAHGDITHLDIPVTDAARARHFYSELFGWRWLDLPGFAGYPLWQGPPGHSGGLAPRGPGFTQPRIYITVDSIAQTLARAGALGATITREKSPISPTSWWAAIEDADGNIIGLYEGAADATGT